MEQTLQLLNEFVDIQDCKILKEDKNDSLFIEGPFLVAETVNGNGRKYPLSIYKREVKLFNENKISKNRGIGELDHPSSPKINLDRVSHNIVQLEMKDNVGIGKAKILDTPMGRIAKTLINENILLGVSTRGVGRVLKSNTVDESYKLITIDLVADPSAPGSFVNGILENKEFIIGENNQIVEVACNRLQHQIEKQNNIESKEVADFLRNFIKSITF